MRVLIAMDSFKESLSAKDACAAVATGVRRALPRAEMILLPLSDGGEGMLAALVAAGVLSCVDVPAVGSDGKTAGRYAYGICADGTAVVETAVTCGLGGVPLAARNPMTATSRGVGMQIAAALDAGARRIVVALGGSSFVDGGMGALSVLGVRFYDGKGTLLAPSGAAMCAVEEADLSGLDARLAETELVLAADVANPYCGARGAAVMYGPQKGATPEMVKALDTGLENLATCLADAGAKDVKAMPRAGAAGGLCGGLAAVTDARVESGFDTLAALVDFDAKLAAADMVITGEGQTDTQTLYGKLPIQVARRAAAQKKPTFCLSGSVLVGGEALAACGVTAAWSIADRPMSLYEALPRTADLLTGAAETLVRTALALAPAKLRK